MKQTLMILVILCASFASATSMAYRRPVGTHGNALLAIPTVQSDNPVVQWNRILLEIVRTPGAQPSTIHPTRSFAIMHAAIYDAVNAIDRTHRPYFVHFSTPHNASPEAAADVAAYRILVELYPGQKALLDARLAESLALIQDGIGKARGFHLGLIVAKRILMLRSNDGSNAQPIPFTSGGDPGDYQLTPPSFSQPVFTHWSRVTPFTLTSADQFRPGPPPELTSDTYTAAFKEVKELGDLNSTARTAEQTEIARFWSAPIQNYWNEIAQTLVHEHNLGLAQSARLFALLNLSIADSVIAFYDAKYIYHFWRPVTAVQAAESDGNPETVADLSWVPLLNTPLDPSYPGAHSVVSACSASILSAFFGRHDLKFSVRSEVLPGVEHSFTNLTAAVEEAGLSRTYAGVHFRFDHTSGLRQGREIASFVFRHFLGPHLFSDH